MFCSGVACSQYAAQPIGSLKPDSSEQTLIRRNVAGSLSADYQTSFLIAFRVSRLVDLDQ